MENLKEKIENWLEPKLEMEGLFLVGVEVSGQFKIQVYIDADDNTLDIRKCVRVSRHLEEHLDADDEVAEKYTLDVSSPGLDNPLKIPRQYQKLIGKTLIVKTVEQEHLTVELIAVNDEEITVKETLIIDKSLKGKKPNASLLKEKLLKEPFKISYQNIAKARLHFDI
jgi:ribosome maturation factor RimP